MYEILVKEDLTPTTKLFEILAPPVARKAQAGQFIIVRVDERGERTPLTVADYDRERGAITIVVQAVGKTTMHMCTLQRGDHFAALTGPLGHPSEIKNYGTVVCVGAAQASPLFIPWPASACIWMRKSRRWRGGNKRANNVPRTTPEWRKQYDDWTCPYLWQTPRPKRMASNYL